IAGNPAERCPNLFAGTQPRAADGGTAAAQLATGGARPPADSPAGRRQSPTPAKKSHARKTRPHRFAHRPAESTSDGSVSPFRAPPPDALPKPAGRGADRRRRVQGCQLALL